MSAAKIVRMGGHQALLAMRRKGFRPALGVRLDCGALDPSAVIGWHKGSQRAVLCVATGADPREFDLRCLHALPVVLVAETWRTPAWLGALVAKVKEAKPSLLTVLRIDYAPDCYPVDAYEVPAEGKPVKVNELTVFERAFA